MTSRYLKILIEFNHWVFNLEGEEPVVYMTRMNTNEDNAIYTPTPR